MRRATRSSKFQREQSKQRRAATSHLEVVLVQYSNPMGSRGGSISGKAPTSSSSSSLPTMWACLALCLLLVLAHCSPCQGRKLLAEAQEEGSKQAMYFEGGLVLRAPPPPSVVGEEPAASTSVPPPPPPTGAITSPVARGFAATGRAARLMRSVPSPGVGH